MRNSDDIIGLESYLRVLGLIAGNARLMGMRDFEKHTDQLDDEFEDKPDMG